MLDFFTGKKGVLVKSVYVLFLTHSFVWVFYMLILSGNAGHLKCIMWVSLLRISSQNWQEVQRLSAADVD